MVIHSKSVIYTKQLNTQWNWWRNTMDKHFRHVSEVQPTSPTNNQGGWVSC